MRSAEDQLVGRSDRDDGKRYFRVVALGKVAAVVKGFRSGPRSPAYGARNTSSAIVSTIARMIHSAAGNAANHVRMKMHSRMSRSDIGQYRKWLKPLPNKNSSSRISSTRAEAAAEARVRICFTPAVLRVVAATAAEQNHYEDDCQDQEHEPFKNVRRE
jgi:hypothetical protein